MSIVDDRLAKIVEKVEQEHAKFGLKDVAINQSSSELLKLDEITMSSWSPEDIFKAEIQLNSYAFQIQKHCNTASYIRNWAERSLGFVVAKHYNDYDKYTPHEVRRNLIIIDNEHATRLYEIINEQTAIIDSMIYIAQTIHNVSNSLANLGRAKSRIKE